MTSENISTRVVYIREPLTDVYRERHVTPQLCFEGHCSYFSQLHDCSQGLYVIHIKKFVHYIEGRPYCQV